MAARHRERVEALEREGRQLEAKAARRRARDLHRTQVQAAHEADTSVDLTMATFQLGHAEGALIGLKATGNAATDTTVSMVTLGYVDNCELITISDWERPDYNLSYAGCRASTEVLAGVCLGGLSTMSKGSTGLRVVANGARVLDIGQNFVEVGRGGVSVYNEGLTVGNSLQILGGASGLAGEMLPALGRSSDEVADAMSAGKKADVPDLVDAAPKNAASRFGDRSWKNLVEGQAHGSGAHKFRTYREAIRMAKSGQYDRIYLNRSLRTVTNGATDSLRRPDVLGVLKNGRVDMVEVLSPSQTQNMLWDKINYMKQLLGESAGSGQVVAPH
jgi:hypothetical protein